MKRPSSALSAMTLAVWACAAQAAPPVPDAGQITREVQAPADLPAPASVSPLRVEESARAPAASENPVRIAVKAIRVSGNQVFPSAELEALVADLSGAEHSLAELDAGAMRISRHYRDRGYLVARAYLPAQDITDGTVRIQVLEGVLDQRQLSNQSHLPDTLASRYLGEVKSGAVLQAQSVDRALLLLADSPGVGAIRAALQPGASVGTTDLLVELDPGQAYSATVDADNHGNRYTGEYRVGAALLLNSPFGLGDLLSLRALTSGANLGYGRLAYQLPLGPGGLRVGAAYADTHYQLGEEFASLHQHGSASSSSVYATYPLLRSQGANLYATLSWEGKQLHDQTDAPVFDAKKAVQMGTLGLAGNRQDTLGAGSVSAFELSLSNGELSMDSASAALDANSARSQGSFAKLAYGLTRLQQLNVRNALWLSVSGQEASKNLGSSEKFSLGGAAGVRAYPQGEGSGDQGWLATAEWRHNFTPEWQGVVFADGGSVDINHDPFAAGENTRSISGTGLGLNLQHGKLQLKTALAWRTTGGTPTSEAASAVRDPRLWLQLGWTY